jgi:hypothetical protein
MSEQPLPPPADAVPETPHPPAPWRMKGEAWVGLFQADRPVPRPEPWAPLLGERTVAVALVRYREGTLAYDELIAGPLVRHGLRWGLWVAHIWVDSAASVWGGRRIWGLPKQLARFTWDSDRVLVEDAEGTVAALGMASPRLLRAPLPRAPCPGIGRFPGEWALLHARASGRVAPGQLRVDSWGWHFPYRLAGKAAFSVHASRLSLLFPAPERLPESRLAPAAIPAG